MLNGELGSIRQELFDGFEWMKPEGTRSGRLARRNAEADRVVRRGDSEFTTARQNGYETGLLDSGIGSTDAFPRRKVSKNRIGRRVRASFIGAMKVERMNTYAVAVYYRFDDTYLKRYDGLVGMLASYPEVWMEAPSMFLLRTD